MLQLLILIFCFILFNTGLPVRAEDYKIIINIPSRTLELWNEQVLEKKFPVGVGKSTTPTPIGNFKVISKVVHPTWKNPYKPAGVGIIKPGNNNPLGTRWIGFHVDANGGEYGMHGTNNPFSVGTFCSHGCVRMYVKDSEYLFKKITVGTQLNIEYNDYKLVKKGYSLFVSRYPDAYGKKLNFEEQINSQLNKLEKNYVVFEDKLKKARNLKFGASVKIGEIIHTEPDDPID